MKESNIAAIRKDYKLRSLLEKYADADPVRQFQQWWNEALLSNIEEPNAMTLATCDKHGKPSARIVLLKGLSNEGFVFFTNYESRKGKELLENPRASLVFYWKELERQVRIEGMVTKTTDEKSTEYFLSRPDPSKIAAWSSPQSGVIATRDQLEKSVLDHQQKFSNVTVPRPPNWGGYIVRPTLIEFWQGRPDRLHDRLQYTIKKEEWIMQRLAP